MQRLTIRAALPILSAALCAAVLYAAPLHASSLERQRALFVQVFESAERGDWSAVESLAAGDRELLKTYLLWPDLVGAYLKASLRQTDVETIERYLHHYGSLKPARELRYRYALDLVRRGDDARYLALYESFYQGMGVARLDCNALRALIRSGRGETTTSRARDLWRVGHSQVDECDPVFDYMKRAGLFRPADYQARYELAIEARGYTLARWLGKSIDQAHVDNATRWLAAQNSPEKFLRDASRWRDNDNTRAQLIYAVERLTYDDPTRALESWATVRSEFSFSTEQQHHAARHIALWTARDRLSGAYALLATLPAAAQDAEVWRWRARVSLRDRNWAALLNDIAGMPAAEKQKEQWLYWRAIALREAGQVNAAEAALKSLAEERSYYGFLAADEIGAPYALGDAALATDKTMLADIENRESIQRARELFAVGLDSRGRSEWDAATASLSAAQKRHAAVLASRWGWHSRAIATAASVGEYDDLALRYPLPFKKTFEQHADTARIATTWAYGIARSESLFMRDIRSSAGAVGLMQLMPATGKDVARRIDLPYRGLNTLTDPYTNIRLGTAYLKQMSDRYDGNRVLATAAYNAGPHRVDRWRPPEGSIDARIWIENIPFNETRKYVRRVLAAEAIFHWRLNGSTMRLRDSLPRVVADPEQLALAR